MYDSWELSMTSKLRDIANRMPIWVKLIQTEAFLEFRQEALLHGFQDEEDEILSGQKPGRRDVVW
jgi:hypothetical protein